jgi:crotonobetainyl-CoA:carnitine CoA-transferase CaiB-like acyl-CoA transferase
MLRVSSVKDVPCTLYETLSQYYDSEHMRVAGLRARWQEPKEGEQDRTANTVATCREVDGEYVSPGAISTQVLRTRRPREWHSRGHGFDPRQLTNSNKDLRNRL